MSSTTARSRGRRLAPHERASTVSFVGPVGSYSSVAASLFLKAELPNDRAITCGEVLDCLTAVHAGDVDYAVVPWRNALGGSIYETVDALLDLDLAIAGSELVPVRHCLAARERVALSSIRHVRSHPEALRQCRKVLRRMAAARREPTSSTSAAAKALGAATPTEAEGIAVLCSLQAAQEHGLQVLVEDAADHPDNYTLFAVVTRASEAPLERLEPADHSVFVMSTAHRPGALAEALAVLAIAGVQLTRLESRPLPGRPWEVQFVLEAEGAPDEAPLEGCLVELRRVCTHLRLLGGYRDHHPSRGAGTAPFLTKATSVSPPRKAAVVTPRPSQGLVHVGSTVAIGGTQLALIAGPCAVESREQIFRLAGAVAEAGGAILRADVFKPGARAHEFAELGLRGLDWLVEAGRAFGLPIVTEVMQPDQVSVVAERTDMLQVGARNMLNFPLLTELGTCKRPVLLKRGMAASIEELLSAAEYLMARGNAQVVLCERGIRTFETATSSTLDLSAIPVLRERTHLPLVVDPCRAAGDRRYVPSLARAAAAVGADGICLEVHAGEGAMTDGSQTLTLLEWKALAQELLSGGKVS